MTGKVKDASDPASPIWIKVLSGAGVNANVGKYSESAVTSGYHNFNIDLTGTIFDNGAASSRWIDAYAVNLPETPRHEVQIQPLTRIDCVTTKPNLNLWIGNSQSTISITVPPKTQNLVINWSFAGGSLPTSCTSHCYDSDGNAAFGGLVSALNDITKRTYTIPGVGTKNFYCTDVCTNSKGASVPKQIDVLMDCGNNNYVCTKALDCSNSCSPSKAKTLSCNNFTQYCGTKSALPADCITAGVECATENGACPCQDKNWTEVSP
jgi:hypothetical protein